MKRLPLVKVAGVVARCQPAPVSAGSWRRFSRIAVNFKVRAVRLEDDADAVHTWPGFDTWAVRDGARIDFEIYRLGEGC